MEQSKWVIVRRETGFEKFKRSIKSIFLKLFGKDEKCKNIENKVKKSGEIVVEIIAQIEPNNEATIKYKESQPK